MLGQRGIRLGLPASGGGVGGLAGVLHPSLPRDLLHTAGPPRDEERAPEMSWLFLRPLGFLRFYQRAWGWEFPAGLIPPPSLSERPFPLLPAPHTASHLPVTSGFWVTLRFQQKADLVGLLWLLPQQSF